MKPERGRIDRGSGLKVNIVLGAHYNWVFKKIVGKIREMSRCDILISPEPRRGADVYHYFCPQPAQQFRYKLKRSIITVHHFADYENDHFVARPPIKNWADPVIWEWSRSFNARKDILEQCSVIVCVAKRYRGFLQKQFPDKMIAYIPNAVDDVFFRLKPVAHKGFTVGIVGRNYASGRKGNELRRRIMRSFPARYIFVGERWEPEVFWARQHFIIAEAYDMPDGKYQGLFRRLDALLVTSKDEGGPIPMLEAMAAGIPVISTDVGMSSEIIKDGINGHVIKGYISAIKALSAAKRTSWDRRTIRSYVRDLTWDNLVGRYDEVYSCIKKARR